jgi:hypothetical protein
MPIGSQPQKDLGNTSLTVAQTLVVRKKITSDRAFAESAVIGRLIVGEIISDDLVVLDPGPLVVESPLFGDGSPSSPLTFAPILTEPLSYNSISSAFIANPDLRWLSFTFTTTTTITNNTQVFSAINDLIGVAIRFSNKYGNPPGTAAELNPGEMGITIHEPDGTQIPGTAVLVNLDGPAPDYIAWGIARYMFDTPLPSGTPFIVRYTAPTASPTTRIDMRVRLLGIINM